MTWQDDVEEYVLCNKCTGLLRKSDPSAIETHLQSCEGNIEASPCTLFAVDKQMLLNLVVPDTDQAGTDVSGAKLDAATGKEVLEEKPVKTHKKRGRPRKRKLSSEEFVPKIENITEPGSPDDPNQLRRSRRMPKPKNDEYEYYDIKPRINANDETGGDVEKENDDSVHVIVTHESDPTEQSNDSQVLETETFEFSAAEIKRENNKTHAKLQQELLEKYSEYKEVDKDGNEVLQCPKCKERTFPLKHVGFFGRHIKTCKPSGSDELKCPEPDCNYVVSYRF